MKTLKLLFALLLFSTAIQAQDVGWRNQFSNISSGQLAIADDTSFVNGRVLNNNPVITRINTYGDLLWQLTIDTVNVENTISAILTKDNYIVMVGIESGEDSYYTLKISLEGELIAYNSFEFLSSSSSSPPSQITDVFIGSDDLLYISSVSFRSGFLFESFGMIRSININTGEVILDMTSSFPTNDLSFVINDMLELSDSTILISGFEESFRRFANGDVFSDVLLESKPMLHIIDKSGNILVDVDRADLEIHLSESNTNQYHKIERLDDNTVVAVRSISSFDVQTCFSIVEICSSIFNCTPTDEICLPQAVTYNIERINLEDRSIESSIEFGRSTTLNSINSLLDRFDIDVNEDQSFYLSYGNRMVNTVFVKKYITSFNSLSPVFSLSPSTGPLSNNRSFSVLPLSNDFFYLSYYFNSLSILPDRNGGVIELRDAQTGEVVYLEDRLSFSPTTSDQVSNIILDNDDNLIYQARFNSFGKICSRGIPSLDLNDFSVCLGEELEITIPSFTGDLVRNPPFDLSENPIIAPENSLIIPVRVEDQFHCFNEGEINVEVINIPDTLEIELSNDSLSINFVADSYEWFFNDLPLSFTDSSIPDQGAGVYRVILTVNQCSQEIQLDRTITSVFDNLVDNKLNMIYPSVVSPQGVININNQITPDNLIIYSNDGKVLVSKKLNGNRIELSSYKLERGSYYLRIYNNKDIFTEQIIIQ